MKSISTFIVASAVSLSASAGVFDFVKSVSNQLGIGDEALELTFVEKEALKYDVVDTYILRPVYRDAVRDANSEDITCSTTATEELSVCTIPINSEGISEEHLGDRVYVKVDTIEFTVKRDENDVPRVQNVTRGGINDSYYVW